jgi:3-phosphoinositide dependent protein kinase-1
VGTAEYVSPELLREKSACKASDLWALGCIIYQLLAGRPPFKAANEYLTFQKIMNLEYHFPDGFPDKARDLVERLLVLDPAHRLPVEHIRNHQFFEGITWGKSLWREEVPTLRPYVPPVAPPIRLNGASRRNTSSNQTPTSGHMANMAAAAAMQSQSQGSPVISQQPQQTQYTQTRRPQLHNVTELAPPSQLDIDWSPVLTRNNERILKLGNLIVTTAPAQANSPTSKNGDAQEKPKFSRFFSSNTTKKRERLVLITTAARLVVAATGGNEKKAKLEINLASGGSVAKSCVDAKGLTHWTFDTVRPIHIAGSVLTNMLTFVFSFSATNTISSKTPAPRPLTRKAPSTARKSGLTRSNSLAKSQWQLTLPRLIPLIQFSTMSVREAAWKVKQIVSAAMPPCRWEDPVRVNGII